MSVTDKMLKKELSKLRLLKFQGAGNVCPKCGRVGYFGSITRFKDYIVCGWCNKVVKINYDNEENIVSSVNKSLLEDWDEEGCEE